ncbi:MAG: putative porin [Verrucomicrobia bacterium]|nr:putative porin [Verrucomicrobiota bacterium]
MIKNFAKSLALLGCFAAGLCSQASAQDSGALLDALVKKGILSDQEAEDIRTDLTRDFATSSSAGKLDIAGNVTKLKLAGDARVRYQYDNEQSNPQGAAGDKDRNRYRYRVRFGAIADFGAKWSTGFRLETASGATSTNADLAAGTDNFDKAGDVAYFGQAFINYKDTNVLGADSVDVRVGKLPHKFFVPGVNGFWIDSDLNFEGVAEELVYSVGSNGQTLTLRAGQFVLNNNAANAGAVSNAGPTAVTTWAFTSPTNNRRTVTTTTTRNNTDVNPSLLLINQAEYATKSLKIAPTFILFAAPGDHDRAVVTTSTAVSNFNLSGTQVGATTTTTTNTNTANQASDTAVYTDLATFLVPAEYAVGTYNGKPLAVYGTLGYNLMGEDRAERLAGTVAVDEVSYLGNAGVRYGANALAGDYQLVAEYRYVGNGSYSSLLLDSDFNGGLLNAQGVIFSGTYSITPAITTTVTYFNAFNIEKTRAAGSARGNGFGEAQVLQVDLSARF